MRCTGATEDLTRDTFVPALLAAGYSRAQVEEKNRLAEDALAWDASHGPSVGARIGHFFAGLGLALLGLVAAPINLLMSIFLSFALRHMGFAVGFAFPWVLAAKEFEKAFPTPVGHSSERLAADIRLELEKCRVPERRAALERLPAPNVHTGIRIAAGNQRANI